MSTVVAIIVGKTQVAAHGPALRPASLPPHPAPLGWLRRTERSNRKLPGLGGTPLGCAHASSPPLPLTPRMMLALPLSHINTICPDLDPQQFQHQACGEGKARAAWARGLVPAAIQRHILFRSCHGTAKHLPQQTAGAALAPGPWTGEGPGRQGRQGGGTTRPNKTFKPGKEPLPRTHAYTQTHIHGTCPCIRASWPSRTGRLPRGKRSRFSTFFLEVPEGDPKCAALAGLGPPEFSPRPHPAPKMGIRFPVCYCFS